MQKFIFILALLLAAVAMAAEPSVTFDVQPRVVRLGESATASLVMHGMDNPSAPGFPQIDGLQIQSAGQSSSFSFNNGVQDSAVTFQYQLLPARAGKFTIGPFNYEVGGKKFEMPAVTLEVLAAESGAQSMTNLLFARFEPSTTNIFVQQDFDLVLKVFASPRVNLARISSIQNLPNQGLVIRTPQEIDTQREVVNGEIFDVHRFVAKAQALTAGHFLLAPVLRVEIRSQQRKQRNDPFGMDGFPFFNTIQTEPRDVQVDTTALNIRSVPDQGKPANFSGAIGNFTFEAEAKPREVNAGDPVTLTYRVAGRGNVGSSTAPLFPDSPNFKIYDAKLTSQNVNEQSSSGEKSFEQAVIPRTADVKEIPPVEFTFFNPDTAAYETIRRGPFPLVVHQSTQPASSLVISAENPATTAAAKAEQLGNDIVYLKPAPEKIFSTADVPWYAEPAVIGAQAIPLLSLAGLAFLIRRREILAGDIGKARRQIAPKAARAGIAKARAAITEKNSLQFYESLWESLASYFGHRLNLAPGDVSADRVNAAFARANYSGPERAAIRDLFASCDLARFAGNSSANFDDAAAQQQIAGLESALRACERIKL